MLVNWLVCGNAMQGAPGGSHEPLAVSAGKSDQSLGSCYQYITRTVSYYDLTVPMSGSMCMQTYSPCF